MNLQNRIVLVTGSSVRVGRAIALELASAGAQLVVHYRSERGPAEETAAAIARYGNTPQIVQGDVSLMPDWQRMRDDILQRHGRLDMLVNNAAIFFKTPFLQSEESEWQQFMDVNLKSVYLGCRVFGEVMTAQKEGRIVNIADVSSATVWPSYIPYCVSKAGVVALTRGLAKALAPHVMVNAVSPGTVLLAEEYDAAEEQALIDKTPLRRVGSPQDIAAAVRFLLEGSDFITGANIPVDGGRSLV